MLNQSTGYWQLQTKFCDHSAAVNSSSAFRVRMIMVELAGLEVAAAVAVSVLVVAVMTAVESDDHSDARRHTTCVATIIY